MSIAPTPEPPYTAVIFTSVRTEGDRGYAAVAERMDALAAAWKQVAEHLVAQQRGREVWYADYRVRVANVTRAYGPDRA